MSLSDSEDQYLPEKFKGERRWLGREHHRAKDELAKTMKTCLILQKTIQDDDNTLTNTSKKKLLNKCQDDFSLDVLYSMNKKNRWENTKTMDLLRGAAPQADAMVVERNYLQTRCCACTLPGKQAVAVHSRINLDDEENFEIRTAKCSGRGQNLSNFAPESRELSKKRERKPKKDKQNETENEGETRKPTILYSIIKSHPNKDVLAGSFFKTGRGCGNKSGNKFRTHGREEIDDWYYNIDFEDEISDFDDEDEKETRSQLSSSVPLSDFIVEKQKQPRNRVESSVDMESSEVVEEEKESRFSELVDISNAMRDGFVYYDFDLKFPRFEHQMNEIREDQRLVVRELPNGRYCVDASKLIVFPGRITAFGALFFTFKATGVKNEINIVLNSAIACNPNENSGSFRNRVAHSKSLYEVIKSLATYFNTAFERLRTMRAESNEEGSMPYYMKIRDIKAWKNEEIASAKKKYIPESGHVGAVNSTTMSTVGVAQDWHEMLSLLSQREEQASCSNQNLAEEQLCHVCGHSSFKNLFNTSKGLWICRNCLQSDLLKQIRSGVYPIHADVMLENCDHFLHILPAIIPLPALNVYIKLLFEQFYIGLGAGGCFLDCPSCNSYLYFEKDPIEMRTVSCNVCNHFWCIRCKEQPHWPMTCSQYSEWKPKWRTQYTIETAQGDDSQLLIKVDCSCGRGRIAAYLPCKLAVCPGCKLNVDLMTMEIISHSGYFPISARARKYWVYQQHNWHITRNRYIPLKVEYANAQKVIRKDIAQPCASARKLRFGHHETNKLVAKFRTLRNNHKEDDYYIDLFNKALLLVENGFGLVYVAKITNVHLNKSLLTMLDLCEAIVADINVDSETTTNLLANLEKKYAEVVTSITVLQDDLEV